MSYQDAFMYKPVEVNYSIALPFEDQFDLVASTKWMRDNWRRSFTYAALYVAFVYVGRIYMKNRPKFDLRGPLVAWNIILAMFSIIGAVRVYPEFFHALTKHGFQYSICDSSYSQGVPGFWTWLFTLSKVFELGDTVFIVLRKQQLVFLHWYHHCTVLIYTWYAYPDHTAPGRWFMVMNYTVHSLMYSYYAAKALRWKMPKFIPFTVTTLQLAQMVVGCYISINTYLIKERGDSCQQTYDNIQFALLMYFSYFVLFAHFFYKTYFDASAKFAMRGGKRQANTELSSESQRKRD